MKKPDITDPKILNDAVTLSKSDFANLYTEMGYDKIFSQAAWHSARTSTKGQELAEELNKKAKRTGAEAKQPLSFIGDTKEEAVARGIKVKKVKVSTQQDVADVADALEGNQQTENKMAKGEKGKIAKDLIAAGETDWKVLVDKAGVAKLYAQMLLRNAKKDNPTPAVVTPPKEEKEKKATAVPKKVKPVAVTKE